MMKGRIKNLGKIVLGAAILAFFVPSENVSAQTDGVFNKLNVSGPTKIGGRYLNVLTYSSGSASTHGIKIKTKIPVASQGGMHTISLEGYNYGNASVIDLKIVFYMFNSRFESSPSISSSGGWTPKVTLAEEGGFVVIFLDNKGQSSNDYFTRFSVSGFAPWGLESQDVFYEGWTAVDEPLVGTNKMELHYKNRFGEVEASGPTKIGGRYLNVLTYYSGDWSAHGIKIKTKIPVSPHGAMHTISLEGYQYGSASVIDLKIVFYMYQNGFEANPSVSSSGDWTPKVTLAIEDNFVVIFLEHKESQPALNATSPNDYFTRFSVSGFAPWSANQDAFYEGWTAVDEPLNATATSKKVLIYKNRFGEVEARAGLKIGGYDNSRFDYGNVYFSRNNNSGQKVGLNPSTYDGVLTVLPYQVIPNGGTANHLTRFASNGQVGSALNRHDVMVDGDFFSSKITTGALKLGDNAAATQLNNDGTAFFSKKIGIGMTSLPTDGAMLAVKGIIHTQEVRVDMLNWPDYVFRKGYKLPTLLEVEKYIGKHGHLEGIVTEEEALKEGVKLGEMNAKLLQKVEELTLYIIEQNKQLEELKKEVAQIKKDTNK